ncbi:allantoate permease [Aspergillus bombycis]|uniref:Allantoate permease n=1 Tax=Aspergillus bombycis TaxID=109264 RepID=A0A1F8AJ48_9EURO|nr:allantoate permease [Aspergillus bombycis]OGM51325.1 allantoate permease [Aspergillus bombycis]
MSHHKAAASGEQDQDEHIESVDNSTRQDRENIVGPGHDRALDLIADAGHSSVLTAENNARVLRKIDLRLLPILLGIYFLQQLDKSSLSYASILVSSRQLTSMDSIKVPIGKFLACTTLCWGIALTCMTPANTFAGLLVCRMFLGLFEAGIPACFIAVTQMWYRRIEQPVRLGSWYAMNGVVYMFGSLLSYGLGHIKSSVFEPYQIIFLFFGLITIAFSGLILLFMPDSPIQSKFLTEEDKLLAIERLRMNQQGIETHEWKWDHVKEACLDIKSFFWFALMFAVSIPSGGISTFGPLIIEAFGFDQFETILFNIPFGAVQLVATMGGAWLATKLKMKGPVIALLSLPAIAGCVMLLELPRDGHHNGALLAGYYIISVYPGITPMVYSWSAGNTAGETKKKIVNGIVLVGQCAGNVLGSNLYTTTDAPLYRRGLLSNLAMFCLLVLLPMMNMAYLYFLNKQHEKKRVSMGKSAKIIDHSMQAVGSVPVDKTEPQQPAVSEDNAFKDLTDWENEDFIYVY